MKYRTFTVLMTEEYDPNNSVEMTDEEALKEKRDQLQEACDEGCLTGNFLIVETDDGDSNFWKTWAEHVERRTA